MWKYLGIALVVLWKGGVDATSLLDKVNMYIGTSYSHNISDNHDYGNTMLSIGVPFAHTPWAPQTRSTENKCESPYYYFDPRWKGMRRTHWMSGSCVIDYGTASILPSLTLDLDKALNYHAMNHSNEETNPNYYKIFLQESQLEVEVASQNAAGVFRSRLRPPSPTKFYYLLFMASDTMYNQSSVEISGTDGQMDTVVVHSPIHRWYQSKGKYAGFDGHHVFKTSRPAVEYGIIHGYTTHSTNTNTNINTDNIEPYATHATSTSNGPAVVYMKFEAGEDVTVATACSFVNAEKAEYNLYAELTSTSATNAGTTNAGTTTVDTLSDTSDTGVFDLERVVESVGKTWEQQLATITVSTTAEPHTTSHDTYTNNTIILYTSLWHSLLLPRVVSDADGVYLKFTDGERTVEYTQPQPQVESVSKCASSQLSFGRYYDDYSMWDIFRAQVPLLNLILPTPTIRDIVASLVVKAQQGHWMPIFPAWNSYTGEMVGDHCAVWIADAVLKGLIDVEDEVVVGLRQGSGGVGGVGEEECINNASGVSVDSTANKGVVSTAATTGTHGALYYALKNALLSPLSHYEYANSRGRRALTSHLQYGYIPLEDLVLDSPHPRQQVSRSVEYAYDDYVLAQLVQFVLESNSSVGEERWDRSGWAVDTADSDTGTTIGTSAATTDSSNSDANRITSTVTDITTTTDTTSATTFLQATLDTLREHSTYYKNVIDTSVGFVRGRHTNGTFTHPFDPSTYYTWITETSVWQYTWFVPHNVEHLIELYGGSGSFISKLNTFFDKGYYNHGNEPDHHSVYLSAYVEHAGDESDGVQGGAWQVAPRVSRIIQNQYSSSERGLPGNEDAGQMSAWLVMSAIGIYQVCPGCGSSPHPHHYSRERRGAGGGEYVLGVPLFDDLTLHLPSRGGESDTPTKLHILVHNRPNTTRDSYIQQVNISGVPYQCAFVTHDMLVSGGVWEYFMSDTPNKAWGAMGRKCLL